MIRPVGRDLQVKPKRVTSPETKEKIRQALKGRGKGRKLSLETRIKMSLANKGKRPNHTGTLGMKFSEETREKMRNSNNKAWFKKGQVSLRKGKKFGPMSPEQKQRWSKMFKGRVLTEEWKQKIGRANSIALKGNKLSLETRQKLSEAHKNNLKSHEYYQKIGSLSAIKQSHQNGYTSIEKYVYEQLEKGGIAYEKQVLINDKFTVDAFIPSLNLAIEVDGDYWHSLPQHQLRDKAKNGYLAKLGLKILRIKESEVKKGINVIELIGGYGV